MARKRILAVHDPAMSAMGTSTFELLNHGYTVDVVEIRNWWKNFFRRPGQPIPTQMYKDITAALREDIRKNHYDEVLIDGALAYEIQLRNALQGIFFEGTLLIGTTQYIGSANVGDSNLSVSGCDFAHRSIPRTAELADFVLQTPIPAVDWLVHNPLYWRVEKGIYIRK